MVAHSILFCFEARTLLRRRPIILAAGLLCVFVFVIFIHFEASFGAGIQGSYSSFSYDEDIDWQPFYEKSAFFPDRKKWNAMSDDLIVEEKLKWQDFLEQKVPQFNYTSMGYHGKGIAILTSANGISYTILLLRLLESYNCILPIEVWYVEGDLDQKQLEQIARRGAVPKDLITEIRNNGQFSDFDMRLSKHQRNYQLKSMVLLLSSFQEVLYLDSDNLPARDPSYLFETTLYQDSGAVFWFDIWKTPPDNPIYKVTNLRFENEYEQESGQILLNKEKAWKGLLMAWYFQGRHDFYFSFMLGDKDTFRFGFKLSKTPYKNIGHIPGLIGYYEGDKFCGHSMAQPDHEGKFLFVHATLFKILFDSVEQDKWRHLHYLNQVEAQERLFSVGNSIRYRISYPHPKLFPRLGDNDWGKVCITYELTSEIMRSSEGETKIPNYELREVTLADSELADFETKLFEFSDFKS